MNRTGSLGRIVAGNTTGEGKLLEQMLHSLFALLDVWIKLSVSSFQVRIGDHARAAVTRAADVDHVEIMLLDHAIQVHVNEVKTGRGAPVPEQAGLDVGKL